MIQLFKQLLQKSTALAIGLAVLFGIWCLLLIFYDVRWADEKSKPNAGIPISFDVDIGETIKEETKQAKVQTVLESKWNYYLIVGNCDHLNQQKSMTQNTDYLRRISEMFDTWKLINVSIASYLNADTQSYNHSLLLSMTSNLLPQIDIAKDKFQWIFNVDCAYLYKQLKIKQYYSQLYNTSTDIAKFKTYESNAGTSQTKYVHLYIFSKSLKTSFLFILRLQKTKQKKIEIIKYFGCLEFVGIY